MTAADRTFETFDAKRRRPVVAATSTASTVSPGGDQARVARLEDWFTANDIEWRYVPDFALDHVDVARSLANQARLQALDDRTVEQYAADYQRGDVFPAIVLYQNGRHILAAGGNHRIAGATAAGRATHPAYVVTGAGPEVLHLIAIEDNRHHGLPLTTDERVFHALHLVNAGTHSTTEAAAVCGLAKAAVAAQLDANRGTARAIERDVFGWAAFSTSTKARLNAIVDDDLFERVANMVGHGDILQSEVSDLVGRVNKAEGRRAGEILDSLERDSRDRTRRTRGHPPSALRAPRAKLLSDLDGILHYEPAHVAADCTTPQERAQLANQIKAAARRLVAIEKELWK